MQEAHIQNNSHASQRETAQKNAKPNTDGVNSASHVLQAPHQRLVAGAMLDVTAVGVAVVVAMSEFLLASMHTNVDHVGIVIATESPKNAGCGLREKHPKVRKNLIDRRHLERW